MRCLGLLCHAVVPCRHQSAVHYQHGSPAEATARPQRERGPSWLMIRLRPTSRSRTGEPAAAKSGSFASRRRPTEPGPPVAGSTEALANQMRASTPQHSDQFPELLRAQSGVRCYPRRLRRRDHGPHMKIIPVIGPVIPGAQMRGPWLYKPRSIEPSVQEPRPEKPLVALEGRRVDLLQLLGQLVQLGESLLFLFFGEVLLGAVRLAEEL